MLTIQMITFLLLFFTPLWSDSSLFLNRHALVKEQCPLAQITPTWNFTIPKFPLDNTGETNRVIPGAYVTVLQDASVYSRYGFVTWKGKLYQDSLWAWCGLYRAPRDLLPLPEPVKTDDTIAVIALQGFSNYFHWMLEVLPRLHLLKQSGIAYDKLYCPPILTRFAKESLELMNVNMNTVIQADTTTHLQPKKLVFPSQPAESHVTPLWVVEFLQDTFLKNYKVKNGKRRIFISRKNSVIRRIINEDEIFKFIEPLGFEHVCMDKLSIVEQAQLMHEAEIIMGVHGAAFTNIVFARKGTMVIELFQDHLEKCFFELSHIIGLKHICIKTQRIPELSQEDVSVRYRNTFINMEQFKKDFNAIKDIIHS